jgi:competence protein ComEC
LKIAGVDIRTLHPPPPEWERQRVRNDDSVAIAVRYGDVSIIVPGDVGREGETHMLAHLEPAPFVILKAPHHGSATSSTPALLAVARPRVVVFSAGRDNRFGHPHPLVVARYRAIGAQIFSTAADGAVILDTDGRSVTIKGWLGRSVELKASR